MDSILLKMQMKSTACENTHFQKPTHFRKNWLCALKKFRQYVGSKKK